MNNKQNINRTTRWLSSLTMTLCLATIAHAAEVNTGTLLDDMIDLERLTRATDPAYKTVLFCSYERAATKPGEEGWFANLDGPGKATNPTYLKELAAPGSDGIGRYLIVDVEGPGAIIRTQTADIVGDLRVFLDGAEAPVYEGPAKPWINNPYGEMAKRAGNSAPNFNGSLTGQKTAAYSPIPFAKGCRVEWIGSREKFHFYQIDIRKFAPGTQVATFTVADLERYADKMAKTHRVLMNPEELASTQSGEPRALAVTVEPGQTAELLKLDTPGGGLITRFELKTEVADIETALRGVVLRGTFDGAENPQIEAPVGDFFGAAPGVNPFPALPFEVKADGTMICRFLMPFARDARFTLHNFTDKPVRIAGQARVRPALRPKDAPPIQHFHAHWRMDYGLKTGRGHHRDLPYVIADGHGRFVGCAITVMVTCDARVFTWWGEGDQKTYVDDDAFPSLHGSGTEDFFNYAWCKPHLFYTPYSNQARVDGPDNIGFNSNARWMIADDIPFHKRLDFYMELWTQFQADDVGYGRIVYLYAEPGLRVYTDRESRTPAPALAAADVRPPRMPDDWKPIPDNKRTALIFEFEDLAPAEFKATGNRFWSNGAALRWTPAREGDELTLTFQSPKKGKYQLRPSMIYSPESGIVAFKVNGKEIGHPFSNNRWIEENLHTPFRTMMRYAWLPSVELGEGPQTLTLVSKGKSPESKGLVIGGDFFFIQAPK